MKTTAVLLALATAAIAAPALHDDLEDERTAANYLNTRDFITREKKSANEPSSNPIPGTPVDLSASQISEFGLAGRSFHAKKPIIIKKKIGHSYQVYRDSDEEKLDSPEPCRKQVQLKVCDHSAHSDVVKSANVEDPNIEVTEADMKHSIKLAKEAVDIIQKKIESKPSKTTNSKHGETDSDIELHHDIEIARQALEHVHNKFGILEAQSSHDLTLKDAEVTEDVAFPLAQTEEERLAQWKEAIQNIERNVELVRNIEDSFKSTHDEISSHSEEAHTPMKDKKEMHKFSTAEDMRVSENMKTEHQPNIENLEQHSTHEKSSEQDMMTVVELPEKDMIESSSMVSASKLQALDHDEKARLTSEKQLKTENAVDNHVIDTIALDHLPQKTDMSMKTVEEIKERKPETNPKHLQISDKTENKMKSIEMEHLLEKQRNAMKELHGSTNNKETEDKKNEMKSAEPVTTKHTELVKDDGEKLQGLSSMDQFKQAGAFESDTNMHKKMSPFAGTNPHEVMMHRDPTFKEGKMAGQNTMSPAMITNSLSLDQHRPTMGMKAAEEMKSMPNHMVDAPQMRWSQDKNFNSDMGLMKSAVGGHQAMDHSTHMHGHHHTHQHANAHHLEAGHPRYHDGKSADMDQSNFFMNMREVDNLGQDGHRFRWRPSHAQMHESARTAYGPPAPVSAPASGGAVGLFPNANAGGCGIPLLLSCNPSVVSGSLAKAHPTSYSAPAYRTEDDFNFHSKRDVKKTEKLVKTLNRTPINQSLKTTTI